MNIINLLAREKFNTSKMHKIQKPQKKLPANNCHLKVFQGSKCNVWGSTSYSD